MINLLPISQPELTSRDIMLIDHFVNLINHADGYPLAHEDDMSKEQYAGHYAYQSLPVDSGEVSEASIRARLDFLVIAGADFSFEIAVKWGMSLAHSARVVSSGAIKSTIAT